MFWYGLPHCSYGSSMFRPTLGELSEALTLIQTRTGRRIPIVLVEAAFWKGLLDWMRERLVPDGMIDEEDLNLMQVVEDADQVVDAIFDFYEARGFLQTAAEREQLLYL